MRMRNTTGNPHRSVLATPLYYPHLSNHTDLPQICPSALVNDGEFAATLVIAFVIIVVLIVFLPC